MSSQSMWIAKTGLEAQQTRLAVTSNNLANVATTGFKQGRPVFADLLYQTVRQPGAASSENTQLPSGLMIGTGVRTVATEKLFKQGNITQTENSLDLAISGKGFFEILLPNGSVAYTRDGGFQVDGDGNVVTATGFLLQPNLTVPDEVTALTVGQDGTVTVQVAGDTAPTEIGEIQLTEFINPAGLQPIGDNLFMETASSGAPQQGVPGEDSRGQLIQGALESSNVNTVEELVNMIEAQRAYEMNAKAISTADQMLEFAVQLL
ncbi:MAG: flagellar basal-body rod protein FlgG [Gammaproteobacteria bacterium]|nr:flagellar basal-body rod protein FlgG [Gammaproteobacteria bacterium]